MKNLWPYPRIMKLHQSIIFNFFIFHYSIHLFVQLIALRIKYYYARAKSKIKKSYYFNHNLTLKFSNNFFLYLFYIVTNFYE